MENVLGVLERQRNNSKFNNSGDSLWIRRIHKNTTVQVSDVFVSCKFVLYKASGWVKSSKEVPALEHSTSSLKYS